MPADYQPNGSYGLFVWISAFPHGTIPEAYKPILDKYRLIWIGANRSGNKRVPFWHRFGLAIDAAHNMKKRYTLDLKRVYVGGYSGGGRCASVVAVGFPEHFHGGFYIMGCNYFRMLEVMRQPGSQWSFFQMPHRGILQTVMRRNRYVLLTGEHDFNREATEVIADAYRSDGFNHVTYIEIPGMGHLLPGAGWFERGIAFLDDPSLEVSTNSNDLRAEKERSTQDAETKLDLSPGLEVSLEAELRFEVPKPLKKTFLVYVPTDYTPERSWPVIFCYHERGYQATTSPFTEVTDGRTFIIVGMNYATREYGLGLYPRQIGPEKEFFDKALAIVSERLNVDPTMVFMGGFGRGGYSTSVLGEQLLDKLAGLLILGAGRFGNDRLPPRDKQNIHGKPIFIGVTENAEPHNERSKKAVQIYSDWGADVTFEEWSGFGNSPGNVQSTEMLDWLRTNGSGKRVKEKFAQAHDAELSGQLGLAFTLYDQLGKISQTDRSALGESANACIEAAKAAEKLAQQAEKRLAEAESAIPNKTYAKVKEQLNQIAQIYAGSVFAEHAVAQKKVLLNAKADELEARARAAEDARDYTKAFQLYKLYLTYFSESDRYSEVQAQVETLKAKTKVKK